MPVASRSRHPVSRPVTRRAVALGLLIAGLAATAPAHAALAPTAQRAYVAIVANRGSFPDDDAAITATVQSALTRWTEEAGGAITTFTVAAEHRFDTATDCSSGSAMWNEAGTQLYPSVSFGKGTGNHLIVIGPKACAGGVGTVGTGIADGGRVNVNDDPSKNLTSLMHELGHNFGLEHAHACFRDGAAACTVSEYGNHYAFMGVSVVHTPAYTPADLDSFERTKLGITAPGEVQPVSLPPGQRTLTQSFELYGRGTAAGLRGLEITDPVTGEVSSVDWRSGAGRDALAYYPTALAAQQTEEFNPGITIETVAADGDSETLQSYPKPVPTDGDRFGWLAGQSYADGNVQIAVDGIGSASDENATSRVTVTLTDPSVPLPAPGSGGAAGVPTAPTGVTGTVGSVAADGAGGVAVAAGSAAGTVLPGGVAVPGLGAAASGLPVQPVSVRVRGVPGVGGLLQASTRGAAPGTTLRFLWFADGVLIPTATADRFRVPAALRGRRIVAAVLATLPGFADTLAGAPPLLAGRFAGPATVRVIGTPRAGARLRASVRALSPAATRLRYVWTRDGRALPGATHATLRTTRALRGHRVAVRVVATRAGFTPAASRSPAVRLR